ncbi:MAG: pitrilysin family protein [Bacteroidota bacterium]|jgi:predicted Zn-dependent peptidase|nr:pitrilysin family protein [Bacteroidota bacterium]
MHVRTRFPSGATDEPAPVRRVSVLPSGLRLVTEHVPSAQSLALGVWIDTGSRDELPEENGISHFIEHCVFKGTARRRTHHIAQYLESVGGYLNAFTTKDHTCYYARVLAPHAGRAAHLLADIVLHATFPAREVEKEKQVIIEEIRGAEDDPEDLLHEQFEEQLFGRHPLGQPIAGREATVHSLTPALLHDFVRRHYTASTMVIAAAGAVEHDVLAEMCAREFAAVPSGASPPRRGPRRLRPRHAVVHRPIQQAHFVLGTLTPGYHDPRRHALGVLNAVLGEGMSSRLFQRIRERHGYAYNIYSFLSMFNDSSTFGVYAAVEPGRIDQARAVLFRELEVLAREDVPVRELNRAKEQIIGTLVLGLESMSNRMSRLGRDELVYGRDIPVGEIIGAVRDVSPEDVRLMARQFLSPDTLSSRLLLPG